MIRPPPTSTLFPYTTLFRSNGTVSIRFGPHVVGRYAESGRPLEPPKGRGKDGPVEAVENQTQVSHRSHRPLENSQPRRVSHYWNGPPLVNRVVGRNILSRGGYCDSHHRYR